MCQCGLQGQPQDTPHSLCPTLPMQKNKLCQQLVEIQLESVLACFSCCDKIQQKATWGKRGFIQLTCYSLLWKEIKSETSVQELKQRPKRTSAHWLAWRLTQPVFFFFLHHWGPPARGSATHSGPRPSHQSSVMKMLHRQAQASLMEGISQSFHFAGVFS